MSDDYNVVSDGALQSKDVPAFLREKWEDQLLSQSKIEPAKRFDAGKTQYELIPADALEALARVYTVGALKYGERNWENGMSWSRVFGSLMRHAWAFWLGKETDDETGQPHLAHAVWNGMTLLAYSLRRVGTDNRPKVTPAE